MKKSEFKRIVREIIEDELDEMTTTGNVAGYNTPHAFKKSDGTDTDDEPESDFVKRINTGTGYTQIKEAVKSGKRYGNWTVTHYQPVVYDDADAPSGGRIRLVNQDTMDVLLIQNDMALRGQKWWVSTKGVKVQDKKPEVVIQKAIKLNEGTNRFHQLRKEEGSANQKIGVGIRNIRTQLREIEKFIEWYGKIKAENGLDSGDYWKRTQRHLHKIRERLTTISNKLRKL